MLEDLGTGQTAQFLVAVAAVALGLVALFIVMRFIRGRSNSTFIRGGKNRQPRLAVLDAAPVDARRRLVLVRRDSVEHLILIGGPTDLVIESGIAVEAPAAMADRAPADNRVQETIPAADEPVAEAPPPARQAYGARNESRAEPVRQQQTAPMRDPAPAPAPTATPQEAVTAAPVREAAPAHRQPASVVAAFPARSDRDETDREADQALDLLDAARNRVLPHSSESETAELKTAEAETAEVNAANGPQAASYYEFELPAPEQKDPAPVRVAPHPRPTSPTQVAAFPSTGPVAAAVAARASTPPASQVTQPEPASASVPRQNAQSDEMSDFESILEAELSGEIEMDDLGLGDEIAMEDAGSRRDGDLSTVSAAGPDRPEEAAPARDRSRDSLEEEMNKLLGDLSRRN